MRRLSMISVAVLILAAGSGTFGQTQRTSRVMKDKLVHAQRILEALTTSNYALLERESEALVQVTASPQWAELKTPEFRGYSDAFIKAAQDLRDVAKQRDLDVAAARYAPLVASCYSCHRHLKDSRLAMP